MNTRNFGAIALCLVVAGTGLNGFFGAHAEAREPASPTETIGKPFRISDSVQEYCKAGANIMMCEQAMPQLAAMRAEARDSAWAAPLEALIAKSMRVRGKDWVQIRALECRSTRCALEYAVFVDDLDHNVDGSEELERLLQPLGGIIAPEVNQSPGKAMMVTVLVWQKKN